MKIRILAILLCVQFCATITFSQSKDYRSAARVESFVKEVFPEAFDEMLMRDACLYYINKELTKNNVRILVPNETLQTVSQQFAMYMSDVDDTRASYAPKKYQLENRLLDAGAGIHQTDEVTLKVLVAKGKTLLTYDEVAQEVAFQFFKRKSADVLMHPKFVFAGIGCKLDKTGKKVFVAVSVGNYNLLTMDKKAIKETGLPINQSQYGLEGYETRTCKSCERYKNISQLQEGITVENGEIYFASSDYKALRKILKYPKDGLAVDIVLENQYPCKGQNIVNKQLQTKGTLTKPVYFSNFEKLNLETGRNASTKLKLKLGTLPEGIKDYELNLVIIKDKRVCKNIYPAYTKQFETAEKPELFPFPDTVTKYNTYIYKPKYEIDTITFIIPFEVGRATYKKEDIQAFIDSLKQPSFRPLSITITAYSSIDGTAENNMKLRGDRITSILNALNQYTNNSAPINTVSQESWDMFYRDVVATEYQFLRTKTKEEILTYIKQGDNMKKMEFILKKHRFAEIKIRAEYDISTPQKEQEYVLYAFHKALKNFDDVQALAIQKYMMQQVLANRYSRLTIDKMIIPEKAAYAGLQMNKVWLHYTARRMPIDVDFLKEMKRLMALDMENMYIKRNWIYARLMLETIDNEFYVSDMQKEIDGLLISSLPKYAVDPLNLELQIKSLKSLNKTFRVSDEEVFVDAAFTRIKDIIQIDKTDWKGAMNLASIFIEMNDYDYPLTLMAPMVNNPSVNEDFIFTFLAMCTHTDYMHHTKAYMDAINRATNMNKYRFCELMDSGKMSFQLLENPEFKKEYCTMCNK